tara:strand:- start:305 stop:514 length:210 start_codon:yes stop_codon:yes gene_type:complete
MIVNNFFQIFIGILSIVTLLGCSSFQDDQEGRVVAVVTSPSGSSNVQEEEETPSPSMTEETPSASMTEE